MPLLAAAMAGFGHAISEVGSATIVGGNIHGQTQVMTTSIVEKVGKGDFNDALVYAGDPARAGLHDQRGAHVRAAARRRMGAVLTPGTSATAVAAARCSRSTSSTSTPVSGWRCSARTAPARRRCCGSSPGLDAPAAGRVEIDGVPLPTPVDVRRRIGYATQRPGLLSPA